MMPANPSTEIRVLVWGENRHEQIEPHVAAIYPDGMHNTIAAGISENLGDQARVTTTTLDEPEHGLTEEVLSELDVLVWWGHAAHGEAAGDVAERGHRPALQRLRPRVPPAHRLFPTQLPHVPSALAQRARQGAGLARRPDAPDHRRRSESDHHLHT